MPFLKRLVEKLKVLKGRGPTTCAPARAALDLQRRNADAQVRELIKVVIRRSQDTPAELLCSGDRRGSQLVQQLFPHS
jgi:hypothetical protein